MARKRVAKKKGMPPAMLAKMKGKKAAGKKKPSKARGRRY